MAVLALERQHPSTLLVNMRQLCLSSEANGPIFRWLFQQKLTLHMRLYLKEDCQSPVTQLAAKADLVMVDTSPYSGGGVAATGGAGGQWLPGCGGVQACSHRQARGEAQVAVQRQFWQG